MMRPFPNKLLKLSPTSPLPQVNQSPQKESNERHPIKIVRKNLDIITDDMLSEAAFNQIKSTSVNKRPKISED